MIAPSKTNPQEPEKTMPAQAEPVTGLALLRQPFPANQISKLPKESKKQAEERKAGQNAINNCPVCGGWHHKNAVHLDYVGHAALTDRLLDADPLWTWEPVTFAQDGLPALDRNGGMWIKLTVCGVTRLGYGSADGKTGGDAVKELIGDALRNAAMRFGAALDLWHKGDLHAPEEADEEPKPPKADAADFAIRALIACTSGEEFKATWNKNKGQWRDVMTDEQYARVVTAMKNEATRFKSDADATRKVHEADNIAYGEDPFSEAA